MRPAAIHLAQRVSLEWHLDKDGLFQMLPATDFQPLFLARIVVCTIHNLRDGFACQILSAMTNIPHTTIDQYRVGEAENARIK